MNWQQQFDYFVLIEANDVEMFAPPREAAKAIATYNHALQLIHRGSLEEALPLLKIVADDYPMFPHASHLYGCVMASQGHYPEAAKYLERVSLLAIADDQNQILKRQLAVVGHELRLLQQQERKVKRREEVLRPVKADLAMAGILQKAPRRKRFGRRSAGGQDAESLNQESMLRTEVDLFGEEAKQERERTIRFAVLIVLIAGIIFSVFFFLIRPRLLATRQEGQQARANLAWLEREIQLRANDQPEIAKLWQDYQQKQITTATGTAGSNPAIASATAETTPAQASDQTNVSEKSSDETSPASHEVISSDTSAETIEETTPGETIAETE